MMPVPSSEHRPLKRQKLGPPDVYPQDAKQREDELDDVSVRHGFTHRPQIQDEYGSALHAAFTSAKIASNFNAILKKKADLNQMPDTGRKKQQINIKDNFWHVTPRSKTTIEAWFKDLAGSKPLTSLAKKVPIFPKREEMLLTLCEYSVPMLRASWFVKMTAFYHESKMAESKIKRRPQPDLSQEWTQTITRFLKDHLSKISEAYLSPGGSTFNSSSALHSSSVLSSTSSQSSSIQQSFGAHSSPHHSSNLVSTSGAEYLRYWNYCTQLAFYMYQDGLLDRQEYLDWVVDVVVRLQQPEQDNLLRVILPVALQYLDDITQSEFLSRKISFFAGLKIRQLCQDSGPSETGQSPAAVIGTSSFSGSTSLTTTTTAVPSTVGASTSTVSTVTPSTSGTVTQNSSLQELLGCHQHRPILLTLSCFIQAVALDCPTALVWNSDCEGKAPPWLIGSPLDLLPCPPSDLPMPPRYNNQQVRVQLRIMENHIKERSRAAENRWSLDKSSVSIAGSTITRVLSCLEALDTHCFSRVDQNNCMDTLYAKIFTCSRDSTSEGGISNSVSCNSSSSSLSNPTGSTNNSSTSLSNSCSDMASHAGNRNGKGTFSDASQDALIRTLCEWAVTSRRFGEYRALVVAMLLEKRQNDILPQETESTEDKECPEGSNGSVSNPYVFQDLLLNFLDTQAPVYDENALSVRSQEFGNLVLLFSELIRQDVFSHDAYMCTLISRGDLDVAASHLKSCDPSTDKKDDSTMENIDDDIVKILQNIAKEADAPDSPKDDVNTSLEEHSSGGRGDRTGGGKHRQLRHLIYAQQFPLPLDDAYNHEMNQRYVLLYGVGRARDEARHAAKKLVKEIGKLFSKKYSIDIAEGGKVKRSSRGDINFEILLSRFKSLSFFDQNLITNQLASQVLDMYSGIGSCVSSYLPVLEHISFLMDLMEEALNIHGILDLCCQIIKEVTDIEAQLIERQCLVGLYCPQLTLHVVGILRKYHNCLLVSQEMTTTIFDGLCRLVKHVTNPSDCTSPERVILAHLHDLYTSCSFLKSKHHETFSNAYPKIKQTLYAYIPPAKVSWRWNPQFLENYIKNPKQKIEPSIIKQLGEPINRISFVWSVVIEACSPQTSNEKLNDLAILCSELTACCNSLSSEWLRVLSTLCCSSEVSSGYSEVLAKIDLSDSRTLPLIHSSLSVFTAILISRHCFTLTNFLNHVVFQSLKAAWNSGIGNPEAEPGARLTCHLLLKIFKNAESPQPSQYGSVSPHNVATGMSQRSIRFNCDRYLLSAAAHLSLTMAPVLAVLKAMLIVSDAMSGQSKSQASISDILGTSDGGNASNDSDLLCKGADKACLADFARYALRQICCQEWVRECCLKSPKELCSKDNLLDRMLTSKQALRLLHLICYPDMPSNHSDSSLDYSSILSNILEDLDEWSLRISWLDLKLMYEQHRGTPSSQQELNAWLENLAQVVISVFQNAGAAESSHNKLKSTKSRSISLIAPLISKLPKAIQGRVLKVAGEFLNSVNFSIYITKLNGQQQPSRMPGSNSGSSTPHNQPQQDVTSRQNWPVTSHRPFLQLVLICLEGQEDQLAGLLDSLKEQLNQIVTLYKEDKTRAMEDKECRERVMEALKLRFALVGSLFDTIVRSCSSSLISEWAQLLVNLVIHGVITLTNNSEMFTNVLDMLAALIHSTLVVETNSEAREENRKNYSMVVKKVKKELLDHKNVTLRLVRQLTPFPKVQTEVITLEPWGTITDTKGNKVQDFEKDKKHGLQVAEMQKLNPWDLLEGHRNPAPLSWVWFAATRLERKPLKYEESHRIQRFHTHSMTKPLSYFLEPPPLPQEDLTPVPDKHILCPELPLKEEPKAPDTPSSDQSPRGSSKRGGNKAQRSRRQRSRQASVTPMANPQMQPMPYQNPNFNSNPPNQWPGGFPQQQPQPQQQTYCPQMPAGGGGPRFVPASSQGRIAIRQLLVHRQPSSMITGQPSQANYPSMPMSAMSRSSQMMRNQLRQGMQASHQGSMYTNPNMPGPMSQGMPGPPGQMYNPVGGTAMNAQGGPGGPVQGGMGQYNYQQPGIPNNQMMSQGPGMMGQTGFQQGYQGPMMMRQQQQQFMGQAMNQGQMVQRPQYMQGPGGASNMNMMGGGQGYTRGPSLQPPQMNQGGSGAPTAIMRQRMMMAGGGASTAGGQTGTTQNGSMMMQRPMTGMNPQQQTQQQQQQQGQSQQGGQPQQAGQPQQMMHSSSQGMGYPQPPPY